MSEPKIAGTASTKVSLEANKPYFWCACGYSANQPFCDGSHQDKGMSPLRFEVEQAREAGICMCKRTSNPPFCDGSHNKLG